MRRQDIQLRTLARQGDSTARLRLARMYLLGAEGLSRNIAVGLDYAHGAAAERPMDAAVLVADSLQLQDLLAHGQMEMLGRAAATQPGAKIKLAVWLLLHGESARAGALLQQAGAAGARIFAAWQPARGNAGLAATFAVAAQVEPMDSLAVALTAARDALERKDLGRAIDVLALAASFGERLDPMLHAPIAEAVQLAEKTRASLGALEIPHVQASLERMAAQGEVSACHLLGRALCGFSCTEIPAQRLVVGSNVRKGTAFLLRAADAGVSEAWLHLFRISSDYRSSAANAQMARFCLEKAAACGIAEARRRLGALRMREAQSLAEAESAVELMFLAAQGGDAHAFALLRSLVLALPGGDADARAAIEDVGRTDPWLAARLGLSRHYGLTKLEALSLDPAEALRPWGLVVGPNPFVVKARLSAPRAIPALSPEALANARETAVLFRARRRDGVGLEGTFRQRSANQRRLFERLDIDEALFFSSASSADREALRIGSRWAHRHRSALKLALDDQGS